MGRRRTPGLRREEVAAMAGVGVAWYTWLEQGRVSASRQVLESIGRALRLGPGSFDYMLTVAGFGANDVTRTDAGHDDDSLRFLVDDWRHGPAFVLDRWFDVLASNAAYDTLWGPGNDDSQSRRNHMVTLVTSRRVDAILGGRSRYVVRAHLGRFRAQTAAYVSYPRVAQIYRELRSGAPEISDWWSCQSMDVDGATTFDIEPESGPLTISQVFLQTDVAKGGTLVLQRSAQVADAIRFSDYLRAHRVTNDHRMNGSLARAS